MALQSSGRTPAPPPPQRDDAPLLAAVAQAGAAAGPCVLLDLTGIRSSAFMLLYGTVCVSLVWMHFSFKAKRPAAQAA